MLAEACHDQERHFFRGFMYVFVLFCFVAFCVRQMTPCIEFVRVWLLVLLLGLGFRVQGFLVSIWAQIFFTHLFLGGVSSCFLSCSHIVPNVFPKAVCSQQHHVLLLPSHGLSSKFSLSHLYIEEVGQMGSTTSSHIDFSFGELVKCVCFIYLFIWVTSYLKWLIAKMKKKITWEVPHLINKSNNRYSQ